MSLRVAPSSSNAAEVVKIFVTEAGVLGVEGFHAQIVLPVVRSTASPEPLPPAAFNWAVRRVGSGANGLAALGLDVAATAGCDAAISSSGIARKPVTVREMARTGQLSHAYAAMAKVDLGVSAGGNGRRLCVTWARS